MSLFDNVIGYEEEKEELHQICDMVRNPGIYRRLGARIPRGLLICGEPGVGKTLMATALIEELNRSSFILRRSGSGEITGLIAKCFRKAKEAAPAVILLDDMDKLPCCRGSREEYATLQACIDEIDSRQLFVIATANDTEELPDSLLRSGRFDRKIVLEKPEGETAEKIIRHYLQGKPLAEDVEFTDVAKMLSFCSCAELDTVLNEAAVFTGYCRRKKISIEDIVRAYLFIECGLRSCAGDMAAMDACSRAELGYAACHEAGHILLIELFHPGGTGFAIAVPGKNSFTRRCCGLRGYEQCTMVHLAGMAATELIYGKKAGGCSSDISNALETIHTAVTERCLLGNEYSDPMDGRSSESYRIRAETMIHAEFERLLRKTGLLLKDNKKTLLRLTKALEEQSYLLPSRIRQLTGELRQRSPQ